MKVQQYPKPQYKKARKIRNLKPTAEDVCRYCQSWFANTHEVFEGKNRQNSIKYHMQVKVCLKCHKDIQEHPLHGRDLELKKEFQEKFIASFGYEFWMKTFMRDYR